MNLHTFLLCCFFSLLVGNIHAQYKLSGKVTDEYSGKALPFSTLKLSDKHFYTTDSLGFYELHFKKKGSYEIHVSNVAYDSKTLRLSIQETHQNQNIKLHPKQYQLNELVLKDETSSQSNTNSIIRLRSVEGTMLNTGKKNEVIQLDRTLYNTATNNARQVFAEVPGLNIWESDQTGLQLEIGARGLSPQRTSNFNTRQNLYDISADALGYPESYYTPAPESVERIQLIRGAASLQYGPQFGGMLNFKMKKGPEDKKMQWTLGQSVGSNHLYNTFLSLGGQQKGLNYYGFAQYKTAQGWRPNSKLDAGTFFIGLTQKLSPVTELSLELSKSNYLAKQPGGLTDVQFETDPSQSNRSGNWFRINWNVLALKLTHQFSENSHLSAQFFGLYAQRDALGYLQDISWDESNFPFNRDLILSTFSNWGNETKFIKRYEFRKHTSVLLLGGRYYHGQTKKEQGFGKRGQSPDFELDNKETQSGSFVDFPSQNLAFFAENSFRFSEKFSVTPGLRFEHIETSADGLIQQVDPNDEHNILISEAKKQSNRQVFLYGLGLTYSPNDKLEWYSNFSKNYRAINFNDLYTINPNIVIDSNLTDERGYTIDLGWRGTFKDLIQFDASLFYLNYQDRIGFVSKFHPETFKTYRLKTNISRSITKGLEAYVSVNLTNLYSKEKKYKLLWFNNITFQDGRYVNSSEQSIDNKKVELVPQMIYKTGLSFSKAKVSAQLMYSYVSEQFSDAENSTIVDQRAIYGRIPAYQIMDFSLKYKRNSKWEFSAGANNVLNASYFTRRASGYPGPGIVPSPTRNFYLSIKTVL
ncbi:MAG: TonB-dependent receptor domain-containing protein [Flavobacteriales bacterium]